MLLSRGDPTIFVSRPISLTLLLATAALLVIMVLPAIRKRREEVFVEDN
jgi:putative tricarboxylic transport membrane protein